MDQLVHVDRVVVQVRRQAESRGLAWEHRNPARGWGCFGFGNRPGTIRTDISCHLQCEQRLRRVRHILIDEPSVGHSWQSAVGTGWDHVPVAIVQPVSASVGVVGFPVIAGESVAAEAIETEVLMAGHVHVVVGTVN